MSPWALSISGKAPRSVAKEDKRIYAVFPLLWLSENADPLVAVKCSFACLRRCIIVPVEAAAPTSTIDNGGREQMQLLQYNGP